MLFSAQHTLLSIYPCCAYIRILFYFFAELYSIVQRLTYSIVQRLTYSIVQRYHNLFIHSSGLSPAFDYYK